MCYFASGTIAEDAPRVKETRLYVYDLLSHSACNNFHKHKPGETQEFEWTSDDNGDSLVVRVAPDSRHTADEYRACILALHPNRSHFLGWARKIIPQYINGDLDLRGLAAELTLPEDFDRGELR